MVRPISSSPHLTLLLGANFLNVYFKDMISFFERVVGDVREDGLIVVLRPVEVQTTSIISVILSSLPLGRVGSIQ